MTAKKTDCATWDGTRARYPVDQELYAKARAEIDAEITGYQLAQLRKELGITQVQLAKNMGVSQARVSDIERGDLAHTELQLCAPTSMRSAVRCESSQTWARPHHRPPRIGRRRRRNSGSATTTRAEHVHLADTDLLTGGQLERDGSGAILA